MAEISIAEKAKAISRISDKNLLSSDVLSKAKLYNAAVNRLYYAVFQQAHQFFLREKKIKWGQSKVHADTKDALMTYLMKENGVKALELHDTYGKLLRLREACDYKAEEMTNDAVYSTIEKEAKKLHSTLKELFY